MDFLRVQPILPNMEKPRLREGRQVALVTQLAGDKLSGNLGLLGARALLSPSPVRAQSPQQAPSQGSVNTCPTEASLGEWV